MTYCRRDTPSADWRSEFPDRRDLHVPGEPLARRDAAADARVRSRSSPTSGTRAACGRGTRVVGDRARDRRPARADARRRAGHDLHAPERDGRAGDRRVVLPVRRPAPEDRAARPRLPDEHLSVRGVPPLRRGHRLRAVATTASGPISTGCSTRSTSGRCWCRCRSCCSGARAIQDVRAVIEQAHQVGAHVDPRRVPGRRDGAAGPRRRSAWTSPSADRSSGCAAAGAGYLYVRPDLARDARAGR